MKIVAIGGTGLIGSRTVARLRNQGHDVLAASPSSGVNTVTGEGLQEALAGAEVVLDLADAPSFEDKTAREFFETAGHNLLSAEVNAGVKHHIALSVVGTERLPEIGYFRAKFVQEILVKASPVPFTIIHATQFFEFIKDIADAGTVGSVARLSPAWVQPIAADEVADALANVALAKPLYGTVEIAGPERIRLSDLVARYLKETDDPRTVVPDIRARFFGSEIEDQSLLPRDNARLGKIGFEDWLRRSYPPFDMEVAS
ncbi:MAG: SDR family oxidoreductase [Phyllobacterium sp.]|uniref:SDR family oxidoreductase n=1 Tax=Phyllobacterium sp. TaxID=1871046 RepID=UPI0030F0900F